MNDNYERFYSMCFKEMTKLVVITFALSCLISSFISIIDVFLIVSYLSVHCVVLVGITVLIRALYKNKIWNIVIFAFVFVYSFELALLLPFRQLVIYFFVIEAFFWGVNGVYYIIRRKNCWKIIMIVLVVLCILGCVIDIYFLIKSDDLVFSMGDLAICLFVGTIAAGLKLKDTTEKDEYFKEIYSNCYYSGIVFRYIWSMLFVALWGVAFRIVILMNKSIDILGR